MARSFLPDTDIPTTVASIREIEHLVGVGQKRSASAVLTDIMRSDNERRHWELGVALGEFTDPAERNPLLEEAWARLPFEDPKQEVIAAVQKGHIRATPLTPPSPKYRSR